MSYSDKDIIKILNIQAKTLRNLDVMARDILDEIANQKMFIARLYRELKKGSEEPQSENIGISDDESLPTNVLPFPGEQK
jgi:hypothetical protein